MLDGIKPIYSNYWEFKCVCPGLYGGLIGFVFIGIILSTIIAIMGGISLIEELPRSWRTWRKNRWEKKVEHMEELWYTRPEEQALLSCTNGPRRQVSDLPNSRRTIRLRMLNLKARVCRPFAR